MFDLTPPSIECVGQDLHLTPNSVSSRFITGKHGFLFLLYTAGADVNNQVSMSNSTRAFSPALFTVEAASALRELLDKGHYKDALRLPKPDGRVGLSEAAVFYGYYRKRLNCWGESAFGDFYRQRLEREKGPVPVDLFDLFWLNRPAREEFIAKLIGGDQLQLLCEATVLSRRDGLLHGNVRCIATSKLYALFDVNRSVRDFVYFGSDSQDMVQILAQSAAGMRFDRSLDMCTGSGAQGMTVAGQSEEVICTDINERALAFVVANASLNNFDNVRSLYSDIFSGVSGRFDCITANTPYVPMPDVPTAHDLPMRGGDLGIEFTFDMLDQLSDYLSPKGLAVIYTSDPIVNKKSYLPQEIQRRYGNLPFDFTQLNIFRSYPNTERQRQHFQKNNLLAFDDCVLVVRNAPRFAYHQRAWNHSYYLRSKYLRFNFSHDPVEA